MENLYRLKLLGITYNQVESGVYALILEAETSGRRLPIIIGYPEAQAIECKLQDIATPRPLTHDLIADIMQRFGLKLNDVVIKKLPSGVFAADLHMENGAGTQTIDSRSSDAVALAIRVGAPIYTTEDVLLEAGYNPEERKESSGGERTRTTSRSQASSDPDAGKSLSELTELRLYQLMKEAVESENYEEALKIKNEIERRKKESEDKDSASEAGTPGENAE